METPLPGLATGARSAAPGSAAFLLVAAGPKELPPAGRRAATAAAAAVLLARAGLAATRAVGGWIGAVLALGAGGALTALAWRGADARILAAPGGILQAGLHTGFWSCLGTPLREAGAARRMGSLLKLGR